MRSQIYNPKLIKYSRALRSKMTYGERRLWKYLRAKQVLGYKFRRQVAIDKFIIDFYCAELKLAIEIDGGSHDEQKYQYDKERQLILECLDINFLRFTEFLVLNRIDDVLSTIEVWINENIN